MDPLSFASADEFRTWLEANHATARELWVGFRKKGSGLPSITYPEAVDQALCFGWIDGVRRGVDIQSYANRFTPRRSGSSWSAVNLKRAAELIAQGLMHPAGLRAYEARSREGTPRAERPSALAPEHEAQLRANRAAWAFWEAQPPGYHRLAAFWIADAKQEQTRLKRLATLVEDCAAGRRVKPLRRPGEG